MSKVIPNITIKLEMNELHANSEDSALNSGGTMIIEKQDRRTERKHTNEEAEIT